MTGVWEKLRIRHVSPLPGKILEHLFSAYTKVSISLRKLFDALYSHNMKMLHMHDR